MPNDPVKMEILKGEVESLLQKRAIEEVTSMHPKRGFFNHIFSSPEEDRRMATSDRPVWSESVCSLSSFQNGDIEFNQVSTSERRLGNESGSPRCIFSYWHS